MFELSIKIKNNSNDFLIFNILLCKAHKSYLKTREGTAQDNSVLQNK